MDEESIIQTSHCAAALLAAVGHLARRTHAATWRQARLALDSGRRPLSLRSASIVRVERGNGG